MKMSYGARERDCLATVLGLWIKVIKHREDPPNDGSEDHSQPVRYLCANRKKVYPFCANARLKPGMLHCANARYGLENDEQLCVKKQEPFILVCAGQNLRVWPGKQNESQISKSLYEVPLCNGWPAQLYGVA